MADNYLITGYWGEPHVTAENDRGINAAMFGTGRFVLPVGEQFKAEYIGNNTIRMYDGKLMDNGAAAGIPVGEYVDLLIANAGQGMNRNDLIVFQYKQDSSTLIESGTFVVIQGTETSGTASDPKLTQKNLLSGEAVFDQMALWRVSVSAAAISSPVQLFSVRKPVNMNNGSITETLKFKPENGTSVIASEVYRNLPSDSPTASYKTRNVISTSGASMQFYKGKLDEEPSEEVNRFTLTETDSQLLKPLTVGSGGTGTNELVNAPSHAIIRKAGDGTTKLYYTPTTSGAFYATTDNGGAKFGTLPVAQGGTGKSSVTAGNYLVGNGSKVMVEKTPDEVLKDIGAASADDIAEFATETWVKNQIAKASLAGSNIDLSGYVTKDGSTDMIGILKFKPASGTSVIAPEVYRNLPTNSPTASYKTRNVIASNGAAMQYFKGAVGADPSTEVNRLTLTEEDTQLMKPLTVSSGGTGRDLSATPAGAVFRNASDGTGMYYTPTASGAMYATAENGTPKFGTLPIAQGGTGATTAAGVCTNLGINDYVVAQGTSGGWRYRKWNSGIAECFLSSEVLPTSGTGEKFHSVSLPFEFYNNSYHVSVTGVKAANQNYAHDFLIGDSSSNDGRTTTSITFHFQYTLATPYTVGFTIFVMGRWK